MKTQLIAAQPSFGLNVRSKTTLTSPVSKRHIDIVQLNKGLTIVYSTNYLHNKPTDKLVRVFNKLGDCIKSKFVYFGKTKRITI